MTNLSTKIEQATAPSRELDADIHEAIGNTVDRGVPLDWHNAEETPYYTSSIDAALTLVPEGMRWCVDTCDGRPHAFVETYGPEDGTTWVCDAASPALALCAAALKARNPT